MGDFFAVAATLSPVWLGVTIVWVKGRWPGLPNFWRVMYVLMSVLPAFLIFWFAIHALADSALGVPVPAWQVQTTLNALAIQVAGGLVSMLMDLVVGSPKARMSEKKHMGAK